MIALLGAQRFKPTLAEVIRAVGIDGPLATITAGWQEREDQDGELHVHLDSHSVNLGLYRRAEEAFAADPELKAAHRQRQERLRQLQEFYRMRLGQAFEAADAIRRRSGDAKLLEEEERFSMEGIRSLDSDHMKRCEKIRAEFETRMRPLERPAIATRRAEMAALMDSCAGVAIAGGHVAVLLNRLRLFGFADLLRRRSLFAWSAGAMVLTDRVVLFHDRPPQGPGVAEVLDGGLGLVPSMVALPHPRARLKLDDEVKVSRMALRFAPASCVALDSGACVLYDGRAFARARGTRKLMPDGAIDGAWAA